MANKLRRPVAVQVHREEQQKPIYVRPGLRGNDLFVSLRTFAFLIFNNSADDATDASQEFENKSLS